MRNLSRYGRQFFPVENPPRRWVSKTYIDKTPIWCSVDLRDGNQSLEAPMSLEEKIDFFNLLVRVGFKEIEVGFPAASETEYDFVRALIEHDMVPDDVAIQVLTPSREHIIKKTVEALKGSKNAIVHLYNPTSQAQREQVFKKSRNEIMDIATEGAEMLRHFAEEAGVDCRFQYSPESFTGTEPEFALDVCNAVLDVWKPTPERKAIINLPVTVELSAPHVYADQVEYMNDNLKYRQSVVLSLHPHNDRGCAVADSELGLLAGADRVEGTLFGNGERTGNVDIITLALNMYSQGVDPGLDLSDLPELCEIYERVTRMQVNDRQPYSGKLVFAAFSGSHQDAIAKGIKWHEEMSADTWTVPYLPIDPEDVGREYESAVIRINSQSGKGGISYLLEKHYKYIIPYKMREDVSYTVKSVSDAAHAELSHEDVHRVFADTYVNRTDRIKLIDYSFERGEKTTAHLTIEMDGIVKTITAVGPGRVESAIAAMEKMTGIVLTDLNFDSHELDRGDEIFAVMYLSLKPNGGKRVWGAGLSDDIITSSMLAIITVVNRILSE